MGAAFGWEGSRFQRPRVGSRPGPHALFGCGPAPRLAPLGGWWVRSAGGGECGGEGVLVCVVWRVELVGTDVGPQRVADPVGVHGDAVVVADEVGRAVGEAEFVAGLHVRGG